MQHMESLSRTHTWGVVGVGAVYTWLFTNRGVLVGPWRYAWFIAPLIIAACAFLNLELTLRIRHIAKYLIKIEEVAFSGDANAPGWERYRSRHGLLDWGGHVVAALLWTLAVLWCFWLSWHYSDLPPSIPLMPK